MLGRNPSVWLKQQHGLPKRAGKLEPEELGSTKMTFGKLFPIFGQALKSDKRKFESWLRYFLAVWSLGSYLTSLCLNSLLCDM